MDQKELYERITSLKHRKPSIFENNQLNQFSIFLPLIKVGAEYHILFEIRSKELRRQPGETCFPGGRLDSNGESSQDAAIRETCEELGILSNELQLMGALDYLLSPFGTVIYPYFGWIKKDLNELSPNTAEVGSIFTIPISYLIKNEPEVYKIHFDVKPEENFPFHLVPGGKNYNWRPREMNELFYRYEDKVVWGLTARILHHFLNLIKS
ncbi:NUDIX hydrolase [Bacillus sp. Marseille-P3661]|uniref:NUDIX hydrolase n=1 Tax=Bacillus sp. Marseille-P3661 TaxID=1936234 RepID=UPI000C82F9D3|nr:CoA pyrophosphatase [Bacillus sp. Marseille-P3661]